MPIDERLQQAVDSISDKLRAELTKELSTLDLTPPKADDASLDRLADAMRAMDRGTSLSEILEALAAAASCECTRTGVFLLSGGLLRSFRIAGLPEDVDQLPADVKSVPLVLAGSQIGAVYAESAAMPAVEILARFASRALEALTAMKTARAVAEGQIA